MTAPEFDRLAASCSHCGAEPGKRCMAVCDWARKPHAARVRLSLALAAHADPLLLPWFPRIGPCGICGVPGLDQQHRVIDAIADHMEAGEYPEEVQAEFPWVPLDGVLAVRAWSLKWPGATG